MSGTVKQNTRAPKVAPVDKKHYEQKIDAIDSEIKEIKTKIQALSKQIAAKSTGKDEFYREKDDIKAKLDECQQRLDKMDGDKKKIQDAIQAQLQSSKDMRQELNSITKKFGYQTEEEIDKAIAEIEYSMHTETLNLKREKELMAEISKLKQVKPQLTKLKAKSSTQGTSDNVGGLKQQLEEIKKQMAVVREEKQKHSAAMGKLSEQRKKAMSGVTGFFEERDKLNEQMKQKLGEIKAIKDERAQKIKEFNAYITEQKAARAERDKADRAVKQAEQEKRRLEDELEKDTMTPFITEIELIHNMVLYCKRLQNPNGEDHSALNGAPKEVKPIQGTDVLVSKKDREEVFFFAPQKKKETKKEAGLVDLAKPIKNSLETLHLFAQVHVDPPTAVKEIPRTLENLEKKLQEFKQKQAQEIVDRKTRRADKEKAVQDAAKALEAAQQEAKKAVVAHPEDD